MKIASRIVKIFKADIHGVMDQLENQDLLLKQHLRDMEEALIHKDAKLQKMITSQNKAQQEHDQYKRQCETLERDLTVAVQKNKDDIARMLIKKIKPLDDLRIELSRHIQTLDEEITQFRNHLEEQRLRYEQLKHRSTEYFHKVRIQQREKDIPDSVTDSIYKEMSEQEIELELLKRKEALGV